MTKIKRSRWDYIPLPQQNETVLGESETQQGESYTIQELFEKHRIGVLPFDVSQKENYSENPSHDDYDLERLKNLDIVDKMEIRNNIKVTLNEDLQNISQKENAKKLAELQKESAEQNENERKKTDQKADESESAAKTKGDK